MKDPCLKTLEDVCSRETVPDDYPLAKSIEASLPVYLGEAIRRASGEDDTAMLLEEWERVLAEGPGIFVVRDAFEDVGVVDRCTALFRLIADDERRAGTGRGDHFGNNERIWNALQKVAVRDPGLFIDYFGNPVIALASEAWLGPGYQVTAQVNNVRPGSPAQAMHRDYHLGFQEPETVARYPVRVQVASQYLTLQGAVAHDDMPVETGPTMLLPYSHLYERGYEDTPLADFQAFFDANRVQPVLSKGDAIFFSPAVFHAAGENRSGRDRVANLLQISSAFGRAMESIDTRATIEAVYPVLLDRVRASSVDERRIHDTVAACASGYAFPTNLDTDPPVDGRAPETEQALILRALADRWPPDRVVATLDARQRRRRP